MKIRHLLGIVVLLFASIFHGLPVNGVRLSIQNGTDVLLRWPSTPGQRFIIGYKPTLTDASWTFLETSYAASAGAETTYVHPGVVVFPPAPSGGGGGTGGPPAPGIVASSAAFSPEMFGFPIWPWEMEGNRPPYPHEAELWNAARGYPLMESSMQAETASANSSLQETPGSTGFYFVADRKEDSDGDGVANDCELYIGHSMLNHDSDGDGTNDGAEDSDSDGYDDLTECLLSIDPLLREDGDGLPLEFGGVFSGDVEMDFTASSYVNTVGPFLDCNNGVTADGLTTTEVSPGRLQLRWDSVFIHTGFESPQSTPGGGGPLPTFTTEERNLLADAFGHGTDIDGAIISQPNQVKIDALPRELLERYEQVAARALRDNFEIIQKANTGQYVPAIPLEQFMKVRVAQIHTQFTRLAAIGSSLVRRFGRAVNRLFPFAGGIMILANAPQTAEDFLAATRDYARDISNGDDETGSAAILAGRCNDLAPGAGNIVLNYLLR